MGASENVFASFVSAGFEGDAHTWYTLLTWPMHLPDFESHFWVSLLMCVGVSDICMSFCLTFHLSNGRAAAKTDALMRSLLSFMSWATFLVLRSSLLLLLLFFCGHVNYLASPAQPCLNPPSPRWFLICALHAAHSTPLLPDELSQHLIFI